MENVRAYNAIKGNKYTKLIWVGKNESYSIFEEKTLQFQKNNIVYCIKVLLLHDEKRIEVECSTSVELKRLYSWLCKLRQFEYLFDGAFYVLQSFLLDEEDFTD